MASEWIPVFLVDAILTKLASLAHQEISFVLGLNAEMRRLGQSLAFVQDFLGDIVAEQPYDRIKSVEDWVKKLQYLAHDADDVLDEMDYEVIRRKVKFQNQIKKKVLGFLSDSLTIFFRRKMTHKIRKINEFLMEIESVASSIGLVAKKKDATPQVIRGDRETTSFINADEIMVGRNKVVSNIVETLINSSNQETNFISVMAIVGMAGLGKTAVAKAVYNDAAISKHFHVKLWVCASSNFSVKLILSHILEMLNPTKVIGRLSLEELLENLRNELMGKMYFLVLDDVWNEDREKWAFLKTCLSNINSAEGSKILVTTRNARVASITETLPRCNLQILAEDDCWSIMKDLAFPYASAHISPDRERIGREIAKKCAGVPLVAKVLGMMLRSKTTIHEWLLIKESKIWALPEGKDEIMSVLKLSFDNLAPSLKQCFAYCSLFMKDFEIEKDNLVQLWMAQGLLVPRPDTSNLDMEDIGNEYFDILLKSFFLHATVDDYGIITKCTMHNLFRDLAEFVFKSGSCMGDYHRLDDTLEIQPVAGVSTSILERTRESSIGRLRSLFLHAEVPSNMLQRFKALRVLNLLKAIIEELPASIGKLKYLRYLDISETRVKTLPTSVGQLFKLQTLRAMRCALEEFPKEVQNLIFLRHVYFDKNMKFPLGMGRLTCLQTLPHFSVGEGMGCGIEELAGLYQLKGVLSIYNLEHVKDRDEAKKAKLEEKINLRHLIFVWTKDRPTTNHSEEDVLEGLEPHPGLESLKIKHFMGAKFPSWMMSRSLSLNNLKKIELRQCNNCEGVPALGHLPNLRDIEIHGMANLKCVGPEFYGYDLVHHAATASKETITLFPALKKLTIDGCSQLIKWKEAPVMSIEKVVVFPCLEELHIRSCPKLRNVPSHFPSLQKLDVSFVERTMPIENISNGLSTLTSLRINAIKKLTCLPQAILKNNKNLTSLEIEECENLTCIAPDVFGCGAYLRVLVVKCCGQLRNLPDGLDTLPLLEELTIKQCPSLNFIPITQGITCLRKLRIECCEGLSGLPSLLENCESLEVLYICRCNLTTIDPFTHRGAKELQVEVVDCDNSLAPPTPEELTIEHYNSLLSFPAIRSYTSLRRLRIVKCDGSESLLSGLEILVSLEELKIIDCPNLETIPSLDNLTSLCWLGISNCGKLKYLPEELQIPVSLKELRMDNCPNLETIPSLHNLTSLRRLEISDCGKLKFLLAGVQIPVSLKELRIDNCPNLDPVPNADNHLTSLRQLEISNCGKLKYLPTGLQIPVSLEQLRIENCPNLETVPNVDNLTSLRHLKIQKCDGLTSLLRKLPSCTSLALLSIESCNNLISVAEDVSKLCSLSSLRIKDCGKLKYFPRGLHGLTSLKELEIGGFCKELDSLPEEIKYLHSVTSLSIQSFNGVEALPEWFGNLTSLTLLHIDSCENLTYLPTVKAMQRLTKLQTLRIVRCPLVKEGCIKDSWSEWHKISHIPEIRVFD
ncbi:putative disease resistance protein RGA1 [Prunus avium]|uniref:Disease resistance protein RGA1 n=1 Tax=Prunus avium TaxID=42229 RepID=A0A6P5S1D0_PRUAV|nr:putative disease resistance protein RGA1 [Prunus avium]XP_021807739.1 putative disease resistance protein RGA1 [Prunus avium]